MFAGNNPLKNKVSSDSFSEMPELLASIDVGTHTARLLVAERTDAPAKFRPRIKKREYLHLGRGFRPHGGKEIQEDAIARTLAVMRDFQETLETLRVGSAHAVATGVVREALNRDQFLTRIYEQTGIRIRPIGGTEEALLTGAGALHSLGIRSDAVLIFDLGGRSTEFYFRSGRSVRVASIPVGAVVLGQSYLKFDPPTADQVGAMSRKVRRLMEDPAVGPVADATGAVVVGTGGTVTSIAAMLCEISVEQISEEKLNGRVIHRDELGLLTQELLRMTMAERLAIRALDAGRAEVITAGAVIVRSIVEFYKAPCFTVSMGGLLEGNLLQYLEDDRDE